MIGYEFTRPSMIIAKRHLVAFDSYVTTYHWQKGDGPYTKIDGAFLPLGDIRRGDRLQVGPFRMLVVEYLPYYDCVYCAWDDWAGRARLALHIAAWWVRVIKARIILTLYVWGAARYREATTPSWRDVHIIRRLLGGK